MCNTRLITFFYIKTQLGRLVVGRFLNDVVAESATCLHDKYMTSAHLAGVKGRHPPLLRRHLLNMHYLNKQSLNVAVINFKARI